MSYSKEKQYFIECILENLPNCIFWKDKHLVFKWCNKNFAKQFGYDNPRDIIGKTDKDLPWSNNLKNKYIKDDMQILSSGKSKLNYEESQKQTDGSIKTVLVSKVPVCDENAKVIGILGLYTDITNCQKVESLKLETELQKARVEEQERFTKIAKQMSHDVGSPLTSLLMMLENYKGELSEKLCITLRSTVDRIVSITNRLQCEIKNDGK